jgi:hypothetical protein
VRAHRNRQGKAPRMQSRVREHLRLQQHDQSELLERIAAELTEPGILSEDLPGAVEQRPPRRPVGDRGQPRVREVLEYRAGPASAGRRNVLTTAHPGTLCPPHCHRQPGSRALRMDAAELLGQRRVVCEWATTVRAQERHDGASRHCNHASASAAVLVNARLVLSEFGRRAPVPVGCVGKVSVGAELGAFLLGSCVVNEYRMREYVRSAGKVEQPNKAAKHHRAMSWVAIERERSPCKWMLDELRYPD